MEKVIKRGYVKWTDEDGVFHKEPLADHPDMLASASPEQQLRAEEARRLNAAAEEYVEENKAEAEVSAEETLAELKKAPEEVLTAAQLYEIEPDSAATETDAEREHAEALARLREETAA